MGHGHERTGRAGRSTGQALRRPDGGGGGGPRRRPAGRGGRHLRLPRPQRRRQVNDYPHAHDAAVDHLGQRSRGRRGRHPRARRGARAHGRGAPGGRARPAPDGARAPGPPGPPLRARPRRGRRARRGAARARGARGRGRPPHQGLLGRYEAPARPRLGARARARGAVPRRADHGAGPGEPPHRVGRGPPHQRARHDGVPHHAVPRGGRRAVRAARDHRRRPDRAPGHAGRAQDGAAGAPRAGERPDARRRVPRRDGTHARPRRRRRAGGEGMMQAWVLGQRALREAWRTPEAILPTVFIPLFFLVVNVGQAGKIFPAASTEFLKGQGYGAFQLPASLLLAASFGTAALFLVEDIEGGYFDKLRSAPIPRTAIVLGRLIAELVKGLIIAIALVVLALLFGITIASGVLGFVLLVCMTALWSVVFVGFMQLIALKTRSAAATNSAGLIFFPLLFLTPNFVPRDLLTRPMEVAASLNPVTYVMEGLRSLILEDLAWATVLPAFAVVGGLGAVMLALNVRVIERYD